jgi:hypothetical protein
MLPSDRPSDARPFAFARRALVLTTLFGAGMALSTSAQAQTQTQVSPAVVQAQPSLAGQTPVIDTSSDSLFSSSAAESAETTMEASLVPPVNFANAMQYGGGQRRYGRPRYRGGNTNQDGSPKYTFFAGVGLSQPIGNTWHYLTPSYGFQVGGGRNFSQALGVMFQFDYDHFGFTKQTITNQTSIYNSPNVFGAGAISSLGGSSHVWSFTLDPTFNLYKGSGEGLGAYAVVGVGFYHKTANFTIPSTGTYCDFYGFCYQYTANQTIDKYTSNAPGFNGGLGLTYKFSRFSNERFFLEARYVFVDNQHRAGFTVANEGSITATSTNLYPANSNRTTYIPIKAGIRF